MSATLVDAQRPPVEEPRSGPSIGQPPPLDHPTGHEDAWPRTSRWLPWMLAVFLVMLWLVPFDSVQANINLPVDAKLDRFAVLALAGLWLLAVFTGGRPTPRWRPNAIDVALIAFVALSILSILLDLTTLARTNDLTLAIKQLSLLSSYILFYFIASTTLRSAEVARFIKLLLGLALISAVGVLYERYSPAHTNLFFDWMHYYLPGGAFTVRPPTSAFVAGYYSGPSLHPLATAAMFAMVTPFALVRATQTSAVGRKILWFTATAVLCWATFATGRKTGDFALAASFLVLGIVRRRYMLRLIPVIVLAVGIAVVAKPNGVKQQLKHINPSFALSGSSSLHRKVTYPAITPDVRSRVVIGRGYGSYDPTKYRILDNQGLGLLIEVGVLGLGAFIAILIAVGGTAWRALRSHDPLREHAALAAIAGTAAFGTSLLLFDTLSYPQEPYMFLFLAALVVAARPRKRPSPAGLTASVAGEPVQARPIFGLPARRRRGFEERPDERLIGAPWRRRRPRDPAPDHRPGTLPHEDEPRRRRGAIPVMDGLLSHARRHSRDLARSRAGKTLAVIVTLGLATALFSRSGPSGPSPTLRAQGGDAGTPFQAFPAPAGHRPQQLASTPASTGAPAPAQPAPQFASVRSSAPPSASSGAPTGPSSSGHQPTPPSRPPASPPHHQPPAPPGNPGSQPGQPPSQPPQQPPQQNPTSCLPPGTPVIVETVLQQGSVNLCQTLGAQSSSADRVRAIDERLRAGVAAGKLSQAQYQVLIADIARAYGIQVQLP